jgi:hypothetical protein
MIRTTAAGVLVALVALSGAPASANPTDDVRAAMLRFAALSSYEMTFGTGARSGTVDFVKPNSMHMTMGPMEMISVGETAYVKQGSGGWMKIRNTAPVGPAEMANRIRDYAVKVNTLTATDLGMKNVGGESLHAYRVTSKDGSPANVYIGRDGLPHRFDSSSNGNNVVRISKFNAVAPIRPPV